MGTPLDLKALALDEIADALQDHSAYEHRWLIDPDELNLLWIEPLPSYIWHADMADFAGGISDERVAQRLARAIERKGAFRRFKDQLHINAPELLPAWYAFHEARASRRAVEWLVDSSLVDDDEAARFLSGHPDPDLP
jgi:hypothetical protein